MGRWVGGVGGWARFVCLLSVSGTWVHMQFVFRDYDSGFKQEGFDYVHE